MVVRWTGKETGEIKPIELRDANYNCRKEISNLKDKLFDKRYDNYEWYKFLSKIHKEEIETIKSKITGVFIIGLIIGLGIGYYLGGI